MASTLSSLILVKNCQNIWAKTHVHSEISWMTWITELFLSNSTLDISSFSSSEWTTQSSIHRHRWCGCLPQPEIQGHSHASKLWLWGSLFHGFLTLTLPGPSAGVSGSLDSYCSLKPLCSGMGEVVLARTSPTLLPPSPRTVLSLSCFKVLQCINCRDWHFKS